MKTFIIKKTMEGRLSATNICCMNFLIRKTKFLILFIHSRLQPPISHTVKVLQVSGGVRLLELAPTGQHLLIAPSTGDPQLWHIMSNSLVHTFKGTLIFIIILKSIFQSNNINININKLQATQDRYFAWP